MVKQYLDRVSVRDFDKQPMSQKDIELITQVINNAPTSTNTQQFSAIIVTDQELKEWIAVNNWGQKHIADSAAFIVFVGDRTRVQYAIDNKFELTDDIKMGEFQRAIVDASIGATYAHDALIAMGYGVTFVGGIMGFADALAEKLNLPETAFITVGLSVGKATRLNGHKPKVNKVFINKYDVESNKKETMEYDQLLQKYYADRNSRGDYLKTTQAGQDPKGGYAPFWSKSGQYIAKKIKNYK